MFQLIMAGIFALAVRRYGLKLRTLHAPSPNKLTLTCVQGFTLRKTLPRATSMYTALAEDLAVRCTRTSLATCAKGNCRSHLFESLYGLLRVTLETKLKLNL